MITALASTPIVYPSYSETKGASKKKCSFNLNFVNKGGRGVPKQTKKFGTLFVNKLFLEFLVERGGGLTKSESFGIIFSKKWGELGCTKVYQKFQNF